MKEMHVGGDDVLTKPINKLELLTRVRSLLRLRRLTVEVQEHRQPIHDILKAFVSEEAASWPLADSASVFFRLLPRKAQAIPLDNRPSHFEFRNRTSKCLG